MVTTAQKAHWIWYPGDYELWHYYVLHTRRQAYGVSYPVFWQFSLPYPNVTFTKRFTSEKEFTFTVVCRRCDSGYVGVYSEGKRARRFSLGQEITLEPGLHRVEVRIMLAGGLPSIYIDSPGLKTDESWTASSNFEQLPAGDKPYYFSPDDDPEVFPFSYQPLSPVSVRNTQGGTLYDFGKETFCRIFADGADPEETVGIYCGESKEEALDRENATIRFELTGQENYCIQPCAFRYLFVIGKKRPSLRAEYEYQDFDTRASFNCNVGFVSKIWDVCRYTFELNSREFYLDGIKRDRWVWSGDAYQSYMANRYLYFDTDITHRTILSLLGKPPYVRHVNTIPDYTMLLIIGIYEQWFADADTEFVKTNFPRVRELFDFLLTHTDENGYICAYEGDWIFIDWADMDQSGPLAAEQILLFRTCQVMELLSGLCGEDGKRYRRRANEMKKKILRDFWREDLGAFVDCVGSSHITRHPNVFAILFDFVKGRAARKLMHSVLDNDSVPQITTPYFEFFELCARGKCGDLGNIRKKIVSYWGGMVKAGASTIWEEYIPGQKGIENYEMYGDKFGRSLCHAWGSGPIYLLGRYFLGVFPTAPGYETFTVEPFRGGFRFINGEVPLPDGKSVRVFSDGKTVRVYSSAPGGELVIGNGKKKYPIPVGKELTVDLRENG